MRLERVSSEAPLSECQRWPALFSLSAPGVLALSRLRRIQLGGDGLHAGNALLITAAILELPEDPDLLAAMAGHGRQAGADVVVAVGPTIQHLQVRLPGPASLRLNALIQHCHTERHVRCSRSLLVSSMLKRIALEDSGTWEEKLVTVLRTPVRDVFPSFALPADEMITLRKPPPGPRPLGKI